MGKKIGYEVKIGQKFDSKVKICDSMSKYWLLKVKIGQNLVFRGQKFGLNINICQMFIKRSKFIIILVLGGQNRSKIWFEVKIGQKFDSKVKFWLLEVRNLV